MNCKAGVKNLFILLLLGMNLSLLYYLHNTNEKHIQEKVLSTQQVDRLSLENLMLRNDILMTKLNSTTLSPHLQLFSLNGDSLKLSQIKKRKNTLVFRYSTNSCTACVEQYLEILKKYVTENKHIEILVLTTYHLQMDYSSFRVVSGKFPDTYNVSSLNLPLEDEAVPYMFILDENFRVIDPFVPRREIPDFTEQYLEKERAVLKASI